MKRTGRQETSEQSILRGLALEWECALWVLDETDRLSMRPPLFRLQDYRGRWATWSRERREISMSRDLVLHHSWDAVREVLLHEMAHQFADEVLFARGETPHGPLFRRACRLLRANPRASGSYAPLDDRVARGPEEADDRTTRRVRKLMALAGSPNRHEAENAMAKAHALIERHNLEILEKREGRDFVSVFVGRPALRHAREEYALANLLQEFHFVQGIWVPAWVVDRGRMGRVLEISGTGQNIRLASYVHDFVRRFIDTQWSAYNDGKGLNRRRRTDYAVGVIDGFRSKLASRGSGRPATAGRAVIRLRDPLLEEYLSYRYPRTVSRRRALAGRDEKVVSDGREAGRRLVIHKGVDGQARGRGRLLPSGPA